MTYRNLLLVCAAAGMLSVSTPAQAPPPRPATPTAAKPAPEPPKPAPDPAKPAPEPPPPPAPRIKEELEPQKPPIQEDRVAYVRRFSIGGRVHMQALGLIRTKDATENLTVGPTEIKATGEGKSGRVSIGLTAQVMLTERIGLGVDFMRSRSGFMEKIETRTGTDNTATPADERKLVTTVENTRATVYDVPVLGRYYMKSRFEEGWRWFVEGGATLRRVDKTVTFTKVDDKCCQQNPRVPLHRQTRGITAGGGIQAVDSYGIKVMPEVRYTWWPTRQFDLRSAKSARHQVEVGVAITF